MPRAHLRCCAAAGAMFVLASCAHYGLGPPPLETDLINDGTPQAQQALVNEYRVEFKNGMIHRPNGDPRKSGFTEMKAKPASDDANNYLTSSEPAKKELETAAVGFDRTVNSEAFRNAIVLTVVVAGAVGGAVFAVPSIISAATGPDRSNWNVMWSLSALGWSMLGGGIGGLLASVPFSLVNHWLLAPSADAIAAADYRRATTAFNKDLEERVHKAARPATAVPAIAPAADLPATAPAADLPATAPETSPDY